MTGPTLNLLLSNSVSITRWRHKPMMEMLTRCRNVFHDNSPRVKRAPQKRSTSSVLKGVQLSSKYPRPRHRGDRCAHAERGGGMRSSYPNYRQHDPPVADFGDHHQKIVRKRLTQNCGSMNSILHSLMGSQPVQVRNRTRMFF